MPGMQSIEGLASNLNITEIIDTILSYERVPVTYMEQDKALKTQQVAAYKAVEAKFLALKAQISLIKKVSSFNKASIGVSDESILSATSNGEITPGSYDLRVVELARNHQLASQGFDEATTEIFGTGTIQLSVGSASITTISIEAGNNSLIGIKDAINEANVGITASIVNDGSGSNPYRLLLTSEKTGAVNDINLNVSLSGGSTFDFIGNSFDNPEILSFSTATTSQVALGSIASYTGNQNKNYTFTIGGNGTQIVGTDNITIDWTDGTNSGSVLVTNADTEVALFGDGADGLTLSFSAGDMVAGDTFQVSTFAPLLQGATDAKIEIGSTGGGGSPIVVNSENNTFSEVLPGLTLNVTKVNNPGEYVTINTDVDYDSIKGMISDMVTKYNDIMGFIDDQFTYREDSGESGVLFADYSLQVMQSTVRSSATSYIGGLGGGISSLSSIGIRTNQNGELKIVNSARFTDAINNDFDNFKNLFIDSGDSSSPYLEFISATDKTVQGEDYEIDITRAATKGYFQGAAINDPSLSNITLDSSNNKLKLSINGRVSDDIVLSERTYTSGEDLANEIQTRIDSDAKINVMNVTVEWVQMSDTGYLKITSGSYGSKSEVKMNTSIANTAYNTLGLSNGSIRTGNNVEGTINGEKATGSGQILTGDEGNTNTEGLKLKVTLSSSMLGTGAEGTISFVTGLASRLDKTLDNITKTIDGSIARKTSALNNQITAIDTQISDYTTRLERRREDLYTQFLAMEEALSQFQAEGSYLESQLAGLQNNWNQIKKNNS